MAKSTKQVKPTKKAEAKTVKAADVTSETTAKRVEKAVVKTETIKAKVTKPTEAVKEVKKITTAKEPKKITAKKEPVKIAAKPEPVKIETKKVEQIALKEEDVVKETKKPVKKATTTKKAEVKTPKTTAKAEAITKTEGKAPKTTAKAETTTKKATAKKEPVKKAVVKKESAKKTSKKKESHVDAYKEWSINECIHALQAMGVQYDYEDYKRILLDEADDSVLIKNIVTGNQLHEASFTYEKDGYDLDVIAVTLEKVKATMDVKAADFKELKKEMQACVKTAYSEQAEDNAKEYLREFGICEKVLMIAQRKNITSSQSIDSVIGSDMNAFVPHFIELAYAVLPTWQYNDVKYYEDFIYAVLSQFADLYDAYQLRVLIDIADLYIKHGDFQHGDVCYGYILRDNQIKDYIYYRFASVYEGIDLNKSKALAYEALQYVDARFTYYQSIMDIIHK